MEVSKQIQKLVPDSGGHVHEQEVQGRPNRDGQELEHRFPNPLAAQRHGPFAAEGGKAHQLEVRPHPKGLDSRLLFGETQLGTEKQMSRGPLKIHIQHRGVQTPTRQFDGRNGGAEALAHTPLGAGEDQNAPHRIQAFADDVQAGIDHSCPPRSTEAIRTPLPDWSAKSGLPHPGQRM